MKTELRSSADPGDKRKLAAYALPMFLFLLLLALNSALKHAGSAFWLASAEYWIYPAQTLLCALLLIFFWREYEFRPLRNVWFAIAVAVAVFVIWISPQQFLGYPARPVGFNPDTFAEQPLAYWSTVILRFLRLVVVVPLVEEIFWRGFLLRYLISEKFYSVPLGKFSWLSFAGVTIGFCLVHSAQDRIAALITGALYNCVAYRTKSLTSCILAHAVTNLLLGVWIMKTRQWGFW